MKRSALRWMMGAPASLADLGEFWMLTHGKGKSGAGAVNLGAVDPMSLGSMLGAHVVRLPAEASNGD